MIHFEINFAEHLDDKGAVAPGQHPRLQEPPIRGRSTARAGAGQSLYILVNWRVRERSPASEIADRASPGNSRLDARLISTAY
ncbi:hypothetical protein GWI33_021356 [Rhynchophorus ferrugineus]|uniref:Uncharacterized protein n=1 Tax=Rhynchophorus ferrugineus TaxID=354439 RepID=A0A834M2I4_RHYFE|nr:hypothetical protein GWI33_021356 [Rhynchophorus ferrugineus]